MTREAAQERAEALWLVAIGHRDRLEGWTPFDVMEKHRAKEMFIEALVRELVKLPTVRAKKAKA